MGLDGGGGGGRREDYINAHFSLSQNNKQTKTQGNLTPNTQPPQTSSHGMGYYGMGGGGGGEADDHINTLFFPSYNNNKNHQVIQPQTHIHFKLSSHRIGWVGGHGTLGVVVGNKPLVCHAQSTTEVKSAK